MRRRARCRDRSSSKSSDARGAICWPDTSGTARRCASAAESPSRKARCGADQSLETLIAFGDGMPEEGDVGSVGGDFTQMLDDARRSASNRVAKLAAAVMTVDTFA